MRMLQLLAISAFLLSHPSGLCSARDQALEKKLRKQHEEPELLYLDIFINGLKQPGVYPMVKNGREIWLDAAHIAMLNLNDASMLITKDFFNKQFRLLPVWITSTIDMKDLTLSITVPPEKMRVTILKEEPKPLTLSPSIYAFYWNYDLSLHHLPLINKAHFLTAHKPVIITPYGTLSNQFMAKLDAVNSIVRLESAYSIDFPHRQIRFTAGDFATDAPSFLAPIAALGLKISKGYMFQTGSLSYPTMNFSGFNRRPVEAEIWINDMLRLKKDLPMGGFVLDNVALPTGAQDGSLILKDANGIISSIPFSYFADSELLRPGLSSYSYSLGFLRKDYGIKSFSYGDIAFFGNQKIGISDYWTPSFHAQLSPKSFLFGLEQHFRLFDFGATGVATAASADASGFGFLLSPQLQLSLLRANFRARAILTSERYSPVGSAATNKNHPHVALTSGIRLDIPYIRHSSLNYSLMIDKKVRDNIIGMKQQLPILNDFIINFSADYNMANKNFLFFAFFSYQFMERHRVSLDGHNNFGKVQTSTGITADADPEKSYKLSYNAHANLDKKLFMQGHANFENRYLRSNLNALGSKKNLAYMASLSGSIDIIKNNIFFSRPIEQGITLFELPGQEGVRIYQNNSRIIGTTNSKGYLLIPDLKAYEASRLSINFQDLSLFANADEYNNGIEITPGFLTAHKIQLPTKMVRHIHFRLLKDKNILEPGTPLSIEGHTDPGFVMNDGNVYFDISDQALIAKGRNEDNSCQFTIDLPPKNNSIIIEKIGDVNCE